MIQGWSVALMRRGWCGTSKRVVWDFEEGGTLKWVVWYFEDGGVLF